MSPVHSELYFGDSRDHWWNDDFVALLARRTELARRQRVLDVGTGFGHFARALLPHLAPDVALTGIDPEERSLVEAAARTARFLAERGLRATTTWRRAQVESLPFPDASFDAVVAQTVLIHVPDVRAAVAEMTRVLAPGGLLLLVEPNNAAGQLAAQFSGPDIDVARVLRVVALQLRIEIGKARLGLGFNSAGETLLAALEAAAFDDVRIWQSDRTASLRPPYDTAAERAEVAERRDFAARGIWSWPRDEARRYYVASGAPPDDFDADYELGLAIDAEVLAAIDRGTYTSTFGGLQYILAATRI